MEAPQTGQTGRSFEPKFLPFSTRTHHLNWRALPLAKLDGYCFRIGTHRAFKASVFITITLCWFDVRQKQLQSAFRTTPSGNPRQRDWIRTIWLRHGAPPFFVTGGSAIGLSVTGTPVGRALVGDDLGYGPFLWGVCSIADFICHVAAHCVTFSATFMSFDVPARWRCT